MFILNDLFYLDVKNKRHLYLSSHKLPYSNKNVFFIFKRMSDILTGFSNKYKLIPNFPLTDTVKTFKSYFFLNFFSYSWELFRFIGSSVSLTSYFGKITLDHNFILIIYIAILDSG